MEPGTWLENHWHPLSRNLDTAADENIEEGHDAEEWVWSTQGDQALRIGTVAD